MTKPVHHCVNTTCQPVLVVINYILPPIALVWHICHTCLFVNLLFVLTSTVLTHCFGCKVEGALVLCLLYRVWITIQVASVSLGKMVILDCH